MSDNKILTKLIGVLEEAGFVLISFRPNKTLYEAYDIRLGLKEIKPNEEKQTLQDVQRY
jgi:hypothetical protein